ncbi:glycyl-tRNA synthetase beta chain [Candidatus Scalindua japonica]|uniref:Glycyl-tRNA synthetase beta chain n=1 Tax=Candidatus Scalindua japonica TaxID=1284222 RepID=A0A286U445_9BACT|nr:hypothetical protein [Candidatus Scalindua japonica]GAX62897.1 glycyl-tRNA synthetase beta chain [Candidatus Scalindua japonica]
MLKFLRLMIVVVVFCGVICPVFSSVFAGKYKRDDFSFEVPDEWVEMGAMNIKGVIAAFTKEIDAEVTPIILVAVSDRPVGRTIKEVVENAVNIVTSTIPDAKFLFERDVYTENVKWREIIYQYSDAGYSFQAVQYHTINNKKHYAFTGQSLQSDFREYLSDFRNTFNSWKFKAD